MLSKHLPSKTCRKMYHLSIRQPHIAFSSSTYNQPSIQDGQQESPMLGTFSPRPVANDKMLFDPGLSILCYGLLQDRRAFLWFFRPVLNCSGLGVVLQNTSWIMNPCLAKEGTVQAQLWQHFEWTGHQHLPHPTLWLQYFQLLFSVFSLAHKFLLIQFLGVDMLTGGLTSSQMLFPGHMYI